MPTITAASASQADIQTAIDASSNGDTVSVPAGSATWTTAVVIGSKRIALIGAGASDTIITDGAGSAKIFTIASNVDTTPVRISGFSITTPQSDGINGYRINIQGPSVIRIDNCKFEGGYNYISPNFGGGSGTGRVTGVIDHNEFLNCSVCIFVADRRAADSGWGETAWAETTTAGGEDMLYFEDNVCHFDGGFTQGFGDASSIYGDYGGRIVVRYNSFGTSDADSFQQNWIDGHGDGSSGGTNGIVFYEIYNNTFYQGSLGTLGTSAMMGIRGGQAIMYNNNFLTDSIPLGLTKYHMADVHVVENTHYYLNTWNGATVQADQQLWGSGADCDAACSEAAIVLGTNFFFAAPATGQEWDPYTPLTYPHPLNDGPSGGGGSGSAMEITGVPIF